MDRVAYARVAELADAPDLGSGAARRGGSTPPSRTKENTALPGLPAPGRQRWLAWLAAVVLVLQLVIPLSYYGRANRYDERFAWRMFSVLRLQQCRSTLWEERVASGWRRVPLYPVLHVGWHGHLRRGRQRVIQALLHHRCRKTKTEAVRLVNHCVSTRGTRLQPQIYARSCAAERSPSRPAP